MEIRKIMKVLNEFVEVQESLKKAYLNSVVFRHWGGNGNWHFDWHWHFDLLFADFLHHLVALLFVLHPLHNLIVLLALFLEQNQS